MTKHCYAECDLCWLSLMLSVKYKPFMLSVIMLNIVTLSVALPNCDLFEYTFFDNSVHSLAEFTKEIEFFSRIYIIRNSIYHLKRGKIDKRWFEKDCRRRPKNLRMLEIFFACVIASFLAKPFMELSASFSFFVSPRTYLINTFCGQVTLGSSKLDRFPISHNATLVIEIRYLAYTGTAPLR